MNRRSQRWRNVAYLLVLAVVAVLVVLWWRDLTALWRQHALTFVVAVLMMILGMVVQAWNFTAFLDVRANLGLTRMSGVWGASALLNYAGPFQPGVLARVVYLRTQGVDAVSSIMATMRQLSASVWLALGGMALGMFTMGGARMHWPALASLAMFIVVFSAWRWHARLLPVLAHALRLQRHLGLMQRAFAGMTFPGVLGVAIQYLIGVLLLLWIYPRFGADMGFGEALVLTCLVYVSALFAVLPGNLGVLEAIYALAGHQLGLGIHETAALALLVRAAHITAGLTLMPFAPRRRTDAGP